MAELFEPTPVAGRRNRSSSSAARIAGDGLGEVEQGGGVAHGRQYGTGRSGGTPATTPRTGGRRVNILQIGLFPAQYACILQVCTDCSTACKGRRRERTLARELERRARAQLDARAEAAARMADDVRQRPA